MIRNYLKIALRTLRRRPGYTLINVAGLTIGLTCCLLIFQYVAFEYSFDAFNENENTLYRVVKAGAQSGSEPNAWGANSGYAMGPTLLEEIPDVVRFTRLHPEYENAIVSNPVQPEKAFEEEAVFYADPAFFQMFSYPLVQGEPGQVLSEPGTVVLSESAARKYFGDANPVGRVLDVEGWISGTFRVAGIFRDVPANSHLQFDILLPMADLLQQSYGDPRDAWNWENFITYVQLRPSANLSGVGRMFTKVVRSHWEEEFGQTATTPYVRVQPLGDVHLNEDIFAPKTVMGSYRTVYFFILIGLVTLLIALVNYINLATARAMGRAREVGVRKAIGAQRRQLIAQFLCESALTMGAATALAVVLASLLRSAVSSLGGADLTHAMWASPGFWAAFVSVFCAATLLAGFYPAFVLSSFRPVAVLKGKVGGTATGMGLRRGLVVFQFAAAIVLLAGTTVVYNQLHFMRAMDLGVDLEQVLTVESPRLLPEGSDRQSAIASFTQELHRIPAVRQVATSSSVPGQGFAFTTSGIRKATADPSTDVAGAGVHIDPSFASLYGLELVAGGGFEHISIPAPEGEPRPMVINETAAQALGFATPEEAIGQELTIGRVVGVFKDFHWSSAHQARENIFFILSRSNSQVSIKLNTENLSQTIAAIEAVYKQRFPGDPFRYAFVDRQFDQQYQVDQRFARLFSIFAGLAILIACLGLVGLVAYTAQQRTKEIGVRKALGASVTGIVGLLSTDFLKLVGLAFVVAAPVAYVAMTRWLADFAYRIDLGLLPFLVAGAAALVIAMLAISYPAVRAARSDPTQALRAE